ncbi:MAG TPA: PKD domain-containing protein [Bryobacteraceae bacterium]|nr:PKD domain-containing protein [Bryobacteraceae bacterium]
MLAPLSLDAQNAAKPDNDYFNFIEAGVFGGVSYYANVDAGIGTKLTTDGIVGVRATENFWNYFGIEESLGFYDHHDLRFQHQLTPTVIPAFDIHVLEGGASFLGYFTPRDSHLRPFLTIGVEGIRWAPSGHAQRLARSLDPALGLAGLDTYNNAQLRYGAGIKWQVSPRIGVRADVRASLGGSPTMGLSTKPRPAGGYYISDNRFIQGLETTIGMSIYLGRRGEKPAAPPPPPPPPPPTPTARSPINGGAISASANSVCPGDPVTLTSNASDPQGDRLSYQWTVNGNNQGGNNSSFTFNSNTSGTYRIGLHVSNATTPSVAGVDVSPVSVQVRQYSAPTISGVTATPASIDYGQTSNLRAAASGSECGGSLRYSWAAAEGTVNGNGPGAQFDSNGVQMNQGDRSRPQSKAVRVTATVTDTRGGSASASADVTVNLGATARHFGDIVFPKDSARVNNCGKRILIEQLYPELTANPNYDVVLVGHIDSSEVPRRGSNRNRTLDHDRVLQTAGVLSGGGGTCASLDRTRIKGEWVGATQESETIPTSCSVSTTAPKERRGSEVNSDEAKNRRVEIWLVPKGMPLPSAARDAKDLPDAELTRVGCPK